METTLTLNDVLKQLSVLAKDNYDKRAALTDLQYSTFYQTFQKQLEGISFTETCKVEDISRNYSGELMLSCSTSNKNYRVSTNAGSRAPQIENLMKGQVIVLQVFDFVKDHLSSLENDNVDVLERRQFQRDFLDKAPSSQFSHSPFNQLLRIHTSVQLKDDAKYMNFLNPVLPEIIFAKKCVVKSNEGDILHSSNAGMNASKISESAVNAVGVVAKIIKLFSGR